MDGQTEFSSLDRVCIPCSTVKTCVALIIILTIEFGLSVFFINKTPKYCTSLPHSVECISTVFFSKRKYLSRCRLNNNCDNRIWPQHLLAAGRNCFKIYFHRFAQRTAKDCRRAYKCRKGLLIIRKLQTKKKQKKNKKWSICTHVHIVTVGQRFTVVHGCNNPLQQKAAEKCNILWQFSSY